MLGRRAVRARSARPSTDVEVAMEGRAARLLSGRATTDHWISQLSHPLATGALWGGPEASNGIGVSSGGR